MKKLLIFSYGLHPGQLTLETLAALRGCGEVFTHCLDRDSADGFARLAPGVRLTLCRDQARLPAAAAAALKKGGTVGFLTYGNPFFLNKTAAALAKAAEAAGAVVRVFPAVSSVDALVNLFGLNDYSPSGLRLVDTSSSLGRPEFTPAMDTLFFMPDSLLLPRNARHRKAFLAAAAAAYPASAPVYLADCASISNREEKVFKGKIGGLPGLLARLNERHTLFIPAVGKRNPGAAGPRRRKG